VLVDLGAFFDPRSKPVLIEIVRNLGIDAVLGVAGTNETDSRDLATLSEQLAQAGCEPLGTIENRVATIQTDP
jgi:Mrp family chromosome partitioning ATPase